MTSVYVTWPVCMSHDLCVCHMTSVYVTWPVFMSHDLCVCHMTCVYVTWPVCMSHDLCVCHMTTVYVTWPVCMSHDLCVCHMTCVYVTWPVCISHDQCVCHMTSVYITWPVCMSHDQCMLYSYWCYCVVGEDYWHTHPADGEPWRRCQVYRWLQISHRTGQWERSRPWHQLPRFVLMISHLNCVRLFSNTWFIFLTKVLLKIFCISVLMCGNHTVAMLL